MPDDSSQTGVGRPRPALTNPRWPFLFVLLSLVALGALPFLTIGAIARYRTELLRIDLARDLTTDQYVAQALAGAFLRDYLETRNPDLLKPYHEAIADDQRARHRFRQMLARFPPAVQQRYHEMVRIESLLQQRIAALLSERPQPIARITRFLTDETLYEQSLIATAQLDRALSQAAAAQRRAIDRAQRLALILTTALLVLAGAAAAAVGWLGRRLRAFALVAENDRRELQHVLEAKARTTRGITHDLKNPLGVIVGHAELLEDGVRGELKPQQREDIGRIKRAAASMLGLLDTMLELARVESGKITVHKADVDLRGLINEATENYRASLEQAGLTLDASVADNVERLETDRARVAQVLDNLISNAAKYTPSGRVEIRAEAGDGAAPQPGRWVAIRVSDTGPGIPPERQEQIFDEFSRLGTEQVSGAGLGLAISRSLARLLGGDITVQSQVGRGSTFTLWLPS
jgi:signal transduction histidine kinase